VYSLPPEVLAALERVKARLNKVGEELEPISLRKAVRHYIETPGKLLRPLLLLTFTYSIDRRSIMDPRILEAAAIVELLHVVSLLQDDVMDQHDQRRGIKTPRAMYGDGRAIVASDWLIAESIKMAVNLGADVVTYLADVAQRLSVGQALDLEGERDKAAEFKTAPLIEAALVMPLVILGRRELIETAKKLGTKLGILYQYSDDYSDENVERPETKSIANEIGRYLLKIKEHVGDAIAPFERLIKYLIGKALEGTLTVSRTI